MSVPQRDALAFWREAASKARGDISLMVPVAELRHIIALADGSVLALAHSSGNGVYCAPAVDDLADSAAKPLRMAGVDGDPDEA